MCCPWKAICSFGDSIVIHFGLDSMGFQKANSGVHSAGEINFASGIETIWSSFSRC